MTHIFVGVWIWFAHSEASVIPCILGQAVTRTFDWEKLRSVEHEVI
jgi:IS1 family transposase